MHESAVRINPTPLEQSTECTRLVIIHTHVRGLRPCLHNERVSCRYQRGGVTGRVFFYRSPADLGFLGAICPHEWNTSRMVDVAISYSQERPEHFIAWMIEPDLGPLTVPFWWDLWSLLVNPCGHQLLARGEEINFARLISAFRSRIGSTGGSVWGE